MAKNRVQAPEKAEKSKRLGQKVGKVVAVMLAASILVSVTICTLMFYALVMEALQAQCKNGTSVLAFEMNPAQPHLPTDVHPCWQTVHTNRYI